MRKRRYYKNVDEIFDSDIYHHFAMASHSGMHVHSLQHNFQYAFLIHIISAVLYVLQDFNIHYEKNLHTVPACGCASKTITAASSRLTEFDRWDRALMCSNSS
jgi:hypothetical protein